MPATISHSLSMTSPNDAAYENQPQHWNQAHAFTINATGSEISNAFSNANGMSFGLSAGAITGSYTVPSVPSVTEYFSKTNTTFNGANISGSITNNTNGFQLSLSVAPPGGGAADGVNIIAAGTQTANTTGTVLFNNANGISFGMANSSVVTASHNALTTAMASNRGSDFVQATAAFAGTSASGTIASDGISVSIGPYITTAMLSNAATISNIRVSAGTTSNLLSALTFGDGNGVSFGLNASTLTASHNGLTSQSNQNVTAANGGFAFQTLSFSNLNGISFGTSAGSAITASHNALTTARASNDAIGLNTALTAGPLAWTVNSSGLSLNAGSAAGTTSGFAGNLISGSMTHNTAGLNLSVNHPAWLTTAMASNAVTISNIRISAGTTSNLLSAFTVNDANGISFGLNASVLTASFDPINLGVSNLGNTAGTTGTMDGRAAQLVLVGSNNITLSQSSAASAMTVTVVGPNMAASASNGSFTFSTLNFSNANNVTFGTSAGGIVTASVAAPGAAAENNWFNLLGNNTAGNTTASGSTIGLSGINVTLSGTNGSVVNVSGPQRYTFSGYNPYADLEMLTLATSQGTLSIEPIKIPNIQFDRVAWLVSNVNSSNSSGSHTLSFRVGIYTQNVSTLSLLTSQSTSYAVTHSGTAGSYSFYSGIRIMTMGLTTTLTEGKYWLAFNSNTTSGGANGSYSMFGISNMASNFLGHWGSSHAVTYQLTLGQGLYTASTTGVPGSIGFSQIRGSDSQALRSPVVMFVSGTV